MTRVTSDVSDQVLRSAPITVGMDGTPASRHALEWAVSEAEAQGRTILAICTYERPLMVSASAYPIMDAVTVEELVHYCHRVLTDGVSMAVQGRPTVQIETKVVEGAAAEVLIEASEHASALVVGSRGHGRFSGLLLGSVSQQCVARAHCPVVVIGPGAHVEEHHALWTAWSATTN
jgi:nucleotide-binding universal stress UspA family protein